MTSDNTLATRRRRFSAALLDFLLVGLVAFIALWPLGIFEHERAYESVQFVIRLLSLLAGSYLLVNGWSLLKRGQTIGKRMTGIRIVGHSDGQLLPLWTLLARAFSVLVVIAIPYVGILAILDVLFIFTPQRRCLHDYLVGSAVHRIATSNT